MISNLSDNAANQAQLDAINREKGRILVDESRKAAEQEVTTAKASRIKTLRFP